jgi:hypothetical protein
LGRLADHAQRSRSRQRHVLSRTLIWR